MESITDQSQLSGGCGKAMDQQNAYLPTYQ